MRIALDIHGVLSRKHKIMPVLIELKKEGHTLIVISGKPVKEMKEELKDDYGYDLSLFDEFYSLIDFVLEMKFCNLKVWYNEKGWWISDEYLWWNLKAMISRRVGVDVLIDDEAKYKQGYLEDKFILYDETMHNNEILMHRLSQIQTGLFLLQVLLWM